MPTAATWIGRGLLGVGGLLMMGKGIDMVGWTDPETGARETDCESDAACTAGGLALLGGSAVIAYTLLKPLWSPSPAPPGGFSP